MCIVYRPAKRMAHKSLYVGIDIVEMLTAMYEKWSKHRIELITMSVYSSQSSGISKLMNCTPLDEEDVLLKYTYIDDG